MARLIVKSPYIKCGSRGIGAQGYLKYIGTREHVELVPDGRPPTKKQEQLAARLLKDYPDSAGLPEYEDYMKQKTKASASAFISRALEQHWDSARHSEVYLRYIATRPHVERKGSHGLFGDEEHVDMPAVMAELETYEGNVWTHIISLHRDDAALYGYDHAAAWRDLLRTHRNDIAAAMHIDPKDFRWYAAFHDEGEHPHIHMMAWSARPGQGYLSRDGIAKIRSVLTNDIFRSELTQVLEQKSESRDALVREAREALKELTAKLRQGVMYFPDMERKVQALAMELGNVRGKKSYGYLPKRLKKQVDEIVDLMERFPDVSRAHDRWLELQRQVDGYYKDELRPRRRLSEEHELRAIKNAVIREAEIIRTNTPTFEDRGVEQEERWNDSYAGESFWRIYAKLTSDFSTTNERAEAVSEMETLAEQGDADAQYMMGRLFRDGPIPIPDWKMAAYFLEKAARQNVVEAQTALGRLLLSEDAEVQNPARGMKWLELAAKNGDSFAAYRLGKEYLRGEFVEQDTQRAKTFFQRAAESGNPYGQYMLGKLLLTEGETEAGLKWMERAAAQGSDYAQLFLERADSHVPPGVILSVTRLMHHLAEVFRDSVPADATSHGLRIDRKRLRELTRQKGQKAAMNYAREEQESSEPGMSMTAPW